ncbi:bifunctional DNA primase/polymerase [Streptomyces sp. NPDC059740]|uniref:bifunctional DNA primase/polymerase n=1 Tax=Streptomyces sp. NPDC059740 TaxID=3346926 RepID=UPI003647C08A
MDAAAVERAVTWLVSAEEEPEKCRRAWEQHPLGVALLPVGRLWDVALAEGPLGPRALTVLRRTGRAPGPVLADFGDTRVAFLVPPGTAAGRLGTSLRFLGAGGWLVVPYPGRATGGVRWLVEPDGSGHLTDPELLDRALHEAAAELRESGS